MMHISRQNIADAARTARQKCAGQQRWLNAIERALALLNDGLWSFDGQRLTVLSSDGSCTYVVDGDGCQCAAFAKGQPCKHRAAWRLCCLAAEMQTLTLPPRKTATERAEAQAAVDELFA